MYTMPRHEKKVCTSLSDLKVEFLLPTTRVVRNWGDRKKILDMPLFPSYVFVHLKDMMEFYKGLHVSSVLYYVKVGKEAARVEDNVVNNIRLLSGCGDPVESTDVYFSQGQQVVIKEGALSGLVCEVVQYKNTQKCLVRVHLLQRNLLISLPSDNLLPLQPFNESSCICA